MRTLLVIGSSGASWLGLFERLQCFDGSDALTVGVVSAAEPPGDFGWHRLGGLEVLDGLLSSGEVTEAVVCLDRSEAALTESVVRRCTRNRIPVWFPVQSLRGENRPGTHPLFAVLKRSMDLVGAVFGLALCSPLLLGAGMAILLVDGRPVFFRQLRAGLDGRPFRIVKFRTMEREADTMRQRLRAQNEINGKAAFKMKNDPRVTRLGRWLRKTSIDELPQLWNVLRGEMSLVGPRPHPYDDVGGYEPWHLGRLAAKPGLTGLWQVELRNDADFDVGVRKDLEYIAHPSVWLDLRVILKTVPVLLRGTGQ